MDSYNVQRAELLVREVITVEDGIAVEDGVESDLGFRVLLVWYAKTLENWKAILTTDLPDQNIYEVTHNGNKNEDYVDVYTKTANWKFTGGSNRL